VHATDKKQLASFTHFRCAGAKAANCFFAADAGVMLKEVVE
jgi:hypothetical protein